MMGEAGLPGQDGGQGGEECVAGPPLNPMPEAVHALKGAGVGVNRFALYVSMGGRRPWAMRWQRKALTPAPGEDRRLTKEKALWAS